MYRIRRSKLEDVPTMLKLAKMVHFINLPPDKDIIQSKIVHSRNSFLRASGSKLKPVPEPVPPGMIESESKAVSLSGFGVTTSKTDLFMFTLEDTESDGVLGTSQVISRMGGPGNPQVSFRLDERNYFSNSLQVGTRHTVATLHLDESGPTEIGGLILQPSFRGHKKKLGRFLSLVRFHFMGLHRARFADRVLAEMMAPISSDGHNLVWDYLGRRYIPLSYEEADRFCQYSREFMISLLPREPLHLSLLPPTVRAGIGEVGEDTKPARRMLERLGFKFRNFIDPFDGGPYLDCPTNDISLVKSTQRLTLGAPIPVSKAKTRCIVSVLDPDGEFRAIDESVFVPGDGTVRLTKQSMAALEAEAGIAVGVTAIGPQPEATVKSSARTAKSPKRSGAATKRKRAKAG